VAEIYPSLSFKAPALADFNILRQLASHRGISTYAAMRPCGLGVERRVLLKVTEATLQFGFSSAKELTDESRLGLRLDHPGLLQTIEYGRDGGSVYQVREWVEGIGLRRLLEKVWQQGSFPAEAALHMAEQLCGVLSYLHNLNSPPWAPDGLIHHGIVPSNVIISTFGEVRLGNLFQVRPRGNTVPNANMQSTELGLGKADAYLAPELEQGESSQPSADIFALGTLLYEAIVGAEALDGDESSDWQRRRDDRQILRKLEEANLSQSLFELLTRAMATSAFERFNSAAELQREIRSLLREQYDSDGAAKLQLLAQEHHVSLSSL
jgi:eukaryotic-like serine/threonine-protein kinase